MNKRNLPRIFDAALIFIVMLAFMTGCAGKGSSGTASSAETGVSQSETGASQTETVQPDSGETQMAESTAESETAGESESQAPVIKGCVAIDAGHQSSDIDMSEPEPYAPGSDVMKAKASTGTSGRYSGIPEYELNMDIANMLEKVLVKRGYEVVMVRKDNDTAISNSERAIMANESGADIYIRLHADGSSDPSVNGASILIPSEDNKYVGHLHKESKKLARLIIDSYCDATGIKNNGISLRDDLTGTNWSEIPVVLLEMGFMSNESDDMNMADKKFRKKMVRGIADGIDEYFK